MKVSIAFYKKEEDIKDIVDIERLEKECSECSLYDSNNKAVNENVELYYRNEIHRKFLNIYFLCYIFSKI